MSDWRMTPEERDAERGQATLAIITALRAEVEILKASVLALHAKRNEDIEHYRSQLSARDAALLALRGFARTMYDARHMDELDVWLLRALVRHNIMTSTHERTPLLTGEPGPGAGGDQ